MNPIIKLAVENSKHLSDEEKKQTIRIFELVMMLDNYIKGNDKVVVLNALDLLKQFYVQGEKE
jgi:hypothetical protein